MQLLKQEVKSQIVNAAKREFLKNGFEHASMRHIAKSAWMTVGNLYRYFDCKESLFETITTPTYTYLTELIDHPQDNYSVNERLNKQEQLLSLLDPMAEALTSQRDGFLILIDGSKGSKYESVKQKWVCMMADHISKNHLKSLTGNKKKGQYQFLAQALAVSFFEGLIEIIRCHIPKRNQKESIKRHIKQFVFFNMNVLVSLTNK